ncbi:MAG: DUF2490 domain-containing protein [Prevotella sp.]|nr:DUF2490 domain-containing protein [Prevotella sp.]
MKKHRISTLVIMAAISITVAAQSESGLIANIEAEKKISKKLSITTEAEMRSRNDFKTIDRWSLGLGANYRFNKWLKADAGYKLLYSHYREDTEYYTSSAGNAKVKWRPSYWGLRHRFYTSLTGTHKFANGLKLSLRERWQYTYRPEETPTRYKMKVGEDDMELDEDYVRDGKGKHVLRSRFQIEYDKKNALFTPFASIELYNSLGIEKTRYTLGTDIRLGKNQSLNVFYRFQDMRHSSDDDNDPDMHYLGIGYKIKF